MLEHYITSTDFWVGVSAGFGVLGLATLAIIAADYFGEKRWPQ